jgi:hypothetical protein
VRTTSTDFEPLNDDDELWLAELETRAIDLENELSFLREARQRAAADPGQRSFQAPSAPPAAFRRVASDPSGAGRSGAPQRGSSRRGPGPGHSDAADGPVTADERTRALIGQGRRSARRLRQRWTRKTTVGVAVAGALVLFGVLVLFRQEPSWPPSVATVKNEITIACQNADVVSEPNQVNFACAKDTSQILWIFALMTSGDNPDFDQAKSGREGLEPITAAQGGEIAWSLNLHHPYNPYNPVDSLAVAARAINNIVGGASLTNSSGAPTVQSGLESNPVNCARYTGSPAVITRAGFPDICAEPITTSGGQAALVADVYQQWLVGAPPLAAQDASILFQNASNPGNPQVQAILKTLPGSGQ